jgi:hypothetical protein
VNDIPGRIQDEICIQWSVLAHQQDTVDQTYVIGCATTAPLWTLPSPRGRDLQRGYGWARWAVLFAHDMAHYTYRTWPRKKNVPMSTVRPRGEGRSALQVTLFHNSRGQPDCYHHELASETWASTLPSVFSALKNKACQQVTSCASRVTASRGLPGNGDTCGKQPYSLYSDPTVDHRVRIPFDQRRRCKRAHQF